VIKLIVIFYSFSRFLFFRHAAILADIIGFSLVPVNHAHSWLRLTSTENFFTS